MAITPKLITGKQFKSWREEAPKVSRHKLIQETGLNVGTIRNFERGKTSPSISTYSKLIEAVEKLKAEANANG